MRKLLGNTPTNFPYIILTGFSTWFSPSWLINFNYTLLTDFNNFVILENFLWIILLEQLLAIIANRTSLFTIIDAESDPTWKHKSQDFIDLK